MWIFYDTLTNLANYKFLSSVVVNGFEPTGFPEMEKNIVLEFLFISNIKVSKF